MNARQRSAMLAAWFIAAPILAAEPTVGPWGDPERLVIEGAKTFPAEEIQKELYTDFHVLLATHPLAPLRDLAPTMQRRLLAGYLEAGFADAHVRVTLDDATGRIVVVIDEGPRYRNGAVHIHGASRVSVEELQLRLTRPFPPKEAVRAEFVQRDGLLQEVRWRDKDGMSVDLSDPLWEHGKPARFDDHSRKTFREQIQQALTEFGYPFAQFDVSVVPVAETRTAELVIEIADEGKPAKVQEIDVIGAEKNSRTDALTFLEIKPGELITHRRRVELEQRLWESGRFTKQTVTLVPPENGAPARLRIELKEYPHAPPLGARLSREQTALLKMRPWLTNFLQTADVDFALHGEHEGTVFDFVFSPRRGLVLSLGRRDSPQVVVPVVGLLASREELGVYGVEQKFRFSTPVPRGQVSSTITLAVADPESEPDPDQRKGPFLFNFGLGYESLKKAEDALPVQVSLSVAPVYCLALAHEKNARTSWRGHVLTLESEELFLQIDARDGRVVEMRGVNPSNPDAPPPMRLVAGEFERQQARLLQAATGSQNLFDQSRPVSSLIAALARPELWDAFTRLYPRTDAPYTGITPTAAARMRLVRRLAERNVFQPLDDFVLNHQHSDDKETFKIPPDPEWSPGPQAWLGQIAMAVALPVAERCFPRESWPWTLCRESALTVAGRPSYLQVELKRLLGSPETGPLCCLSTAALLKLAKAPGSDVFAARGLAELEAEDFQRDCLPFLEEKNLVGKCLHRGAEVLRALQDEEIKQLSRELLKSDADMLLAAARELRRDPQSSADESLMKALGAAWEAGLQQWVTAALESYLPEDTFRIGGRP